MNLFRRTRTEPAEKLWADTLPSLLPRDLPVPRPSALVPLDGVLDGVDVNELDSQTVFDQFFGAPGDPPRR